MVQQHLLRKTVIAGKGVSWFVCCNYTDWNSQLEQKKKKESCDQQSKKCIFIESLPDDMLRYKSQFKVDPCLRWFYQGHSSCTSSAYKVFSYLEDGSQWTATWAEVYDVHTGTDLASLWLYLFHLLSLQLLSTIRRPWAWISSLLWEPRQL